MEKEKNIKKFQLIISILLIMVPPLFFGYFDKTAAMTIALFAGFASAIMINIDKFEYFKAGQLEARIREADKIIEDAHATIDQLKDVAEPLLNTNLSSLIYDGYFDGMNIDDKLKVFKELYEAESNLELNSDTTNKLIEKAKKAIAHHLFIDIGRVINKDPLSAESVFFTTYSIEADKAFATIEEIEDLLSKNPKFRTEKVDMSFEKFKKFMNRYY